jgi:hypothetical protein
MSWNERFAAHITEWLLVLFTLILAVFTGLLYISTRDLVRGAEDTAKKQLRAYLAIEPSAINNFAPNFKTGVTLNFKNFGLTPAYEVRVEKYIAIQPYPFPDSEPFPNIAQSNGVATIYPNSSTISAYVEMGQPLTGKDISAILDGNKYRLYVAGLVRYKDIFGLAHCTRFLANTGGPKFVESIKTANKTGNSNVFWEYTNKYNDADKCQ